MPTLPLSPGLTLAAALARAGTDQGIPSPCVGVCRMDASTGLCEGCWRTLDEIAAWGDCDDDVRRVVWAAIEARQQATG